MTSSGSQTPTNASAGQEPVRWGVLSTAKIGRNAVIPAIAKARNARLVAVASRDVAKAEPIAAQYPSARVFDSYEALLEDPEVEAVYIPLPNGMHVDWTIRATEHGKHVLCEKPLGMTADEVRRMLDAASRAGVKLMEAYMYRFHPEIEWTLEQIKSGRLGEVRLVRAGFAFDITPRPEDIRLQAGLAGGSLVDVGCYCVNVARAVFGKAPEAIVGHVEVPEGSEVERAVGAVLTFGPRQMAVIDCSFELPRHQFVEVVGTKGLLRIPAPFNQDGPTVVRLTLGDETTEQHFPAADAYQLEVEAFGDAVRHNTAVPLSPEDSVTQAEVIEAIYAAGHYRWPRE